MHMHNCTPHPTQTLNTGSRPLGQKLVLHYIVDGHVICEATHHLIADVNFLQIPIPVIHEMKRGSR